jgi:hypothetical protein
MFLMFLHLDNYVFCNYSTAVQVSGYDTGLFGTHVIPTGVEGSNVKRRICLKRADGEI